jgi:diguanylate cyclase (GGDEF)-like protein
MRPVWYLVLPTLAVVDIAIGAVAISLPNAMRDTVIEAAHRSSIEIVDQVKLRRDDQARYLNALKTVSADPRSVDQRGVESPAAFHQEDYGIVPSDRKMHSDSTVVSVSPFGTFRGNERPMDGFQTEAWETFQRNPVVSLSRLEIIEGRRSLRVAVADRMTDLICISCHNSDARSAKHDWKIGDVSAVMEVTRVVEPQLGAAEQRGHVIVGSLAFGGCAVAVVLIAFTGLVVRHSREKEEADRVARTKLAHMANHDSLTGLFNRAAFMEGLEEASARLRRHNKPFCVLMMDLDRFKAVNDTLGHLAGDAVLLEAARRLRSLLRETDVLARLGGDEFAIILGATKQRQSATITKSWIERRGLTGETKLLQSATAIAERMIGAFGEPFDIGGSDVSIGISIGIVAAPENGSTAVDLLKEADIALYRAKLAGRNRYCFFDVEMLAELNDRNRLEHDLSAAISNGGLELHYQPFIDAKTGIPCGVEALARWHHSELGSIPPDRFIPLAEQTGLIVPLGEWVLQKACADAMGWPEHIKVAVNLSPAQLKAANMLDVVRRALLESKLPPRRLELEITETAVLANERQPWDTLWQLKKLGISIALDDFGTGYSSLSYLGMFPFDKIKIDKSFTQNMAERAHCAAIVSAALAISRSLDMTTTAEGVETMEQFEMLRTSGVTFAQGYLFGKASPAATLTFTPRTLAAKIESAA